MPIYKKKNDDFFKKWSSEMAYVLGFFAADGCMIINPRGAHFLNFTITDYELLIKIRKALGSNHKIKKVKRRKNWKTSYRLQIGSKEMFKDLLKLGLMPRKSKRMKLPNIPHKYFSDFVRGYFDGDGCIYFGFYQKKDRKNPSFILMTRFTSGNKKFLEDLLKYLKKYTNIEGGCIVNRKDKSGCDLQFSIRDSIKLYGFIYQNVIKRQFLERKYKKFQEALKYHGDVA